MDISFNGQTQQHQFESFDAFMNQILSEEHTSSVEMPATPNILNAFYLSMLRSREELAPENILEQIYSYCSLVCEGLFPSKMGIIESPEGIYLGIRNLYNPQEERLAPSFLKSIEQFFKTLINAVEEKRDIYEESLFPRSLFPKVVAFLEEDKKLFRVDMEKGSLLSLGGELKGQYALILEEPQAALYRFWSRFPDDSSLSFTHFTFLVSRAKGGNWIICTNPAHKISLKDLVCEINEKEKSLSGAAWDDGALYDYSLIAASANSKCSLTDIIGAIKKWTPCKELSLGKHNKRSTTPTPLLVAGLLIAVATLAFVLLFNKSPEPQEEFVLSRGLVTEHEVLATEGWKKSSRMKGYAVLVSVARSSFSRLDAPPSDIINMYKMLKDVYGYSDENIVIITDTPELIEKEVGSQTIMQLNDAAAKPTRNNLVAALTRMGRKILQLKSDPTTGEAPLTQFIFYYAGHGVVNNPSADKRLNDYGYLVLSDYWENKTAAANGEFIPENFGIDMQEIPSLLKKLIPSSHQMVFLDCCHSGFALKERGLDPHENPEYIYSLWNKKAQVIMAAASTDEFSQESSAMTTSFFTTAVIEALSFEGGFSPADQEPRDNIVTDAELAVYVKERVENLVMRNRARKQTPSYVSALNGEDIGQILFIPTEI